VTVRLGDSLQPKLTSTLQSGIQRSVISCVCIRQLTGNICIEATWNSNCLNVYTWVDDLEQMCVCLSGVDGG